MNTHTNKHSVRVALLQQSTGGRISYQDIEKIKKARADFFCLPEYFFPAITKDKKPSDYTANLNYLIKLSRELPCAIIGGTMVVPYDNKLYNTCFLVDNGKIVASYRKIHLFEREVGFITPGKDYTVADCRDYKVGLLICADVLYSESFENMKKMNAQLIFIPTYSPYKHGESKQEKYNRDNEIFVKAAKYTNTYIIKTCTKGYYNNRKSQGRSLIAGPEKIIVRVPPSKEDRKALIIKDLNM